MLLQVVPAVAGGVHDHAEVLARHWRSAGRANRTLALAAGPASAGVLREALHALSNSGEPLTVLLHFSAYGYGPRGLCGWLPTTLAAVRAEAALPVFCLFHELFATGLPPWRSAFWLSPVQRRTVVRLLACIDGAWTATEGHAQWLQTHGADAGGIGVWRMPVFSNVGEPQVTPPLAARAPAAVVFGSAASRQRVQAAWGDADAGLLAGGIQEVCEIGAGPSCRPGHTALAWRHLGHLGAADVAAELAGARVCVIADNDIALAKSSVLAAAAAHRCVVVNLRSAGQPADGLVPGRHLLRHPGVQASADTLCLQAVADALHSWYDGHRASMQADRFAGWAA